MQQGELWENLPTSEDRRLLFKPINTPVWTENKAKLIAKYLYYFVLITKHGIYIDGFAAPQSAASRDDGWAAKLVLESEPRFLKDFWLCDLSKAGVEALEELKAAQPARPKRRIEVLSGDFNKRVGDILASGTVTETKATFCLIDQRTFECEWATVRTLAEHKQGNKIELFYFLGTGWLERAVSGLTVNSHLAKLWWGREDLDDIVQMGGQQRAEAFCQRFRSELGYTHAHAWPIYGRGSHGRVMYHMIHATDHDEAPKIMARAYRNATRAPEPVTQLELELQHLEDGDVEIID